MKPNRSIFIMYQWQLIDPSSSMHSHQGQYILYYIDHQSINPLTSINHLTSINDINQSNHWHQWQHDPTISPFGIDGNTNIDVNTNYQLLISTCRYSMFYINSQCDYLSTSISPINRHQSHQCDYLSPFDINGKGPFSSWGCSPCFNSPWGCSPYLNAFDLPLNNLSPLEQGISLWYNAENT